MPLTVTSDCDGDGDADDRDGDGKPGVAAGPAGAVQQDVHADDGEHRDGGGRGHANLAMGVMWTILRTGHLDRCCGVEGTSASTASRTSSGISRPAVLQPRPDDADQLRVGRHRATSRSGERPSASSAARSPRIA